VLAQPLAVLVPWCGGRGRGHADDRTGRPTRRAAPENARGARSQGGTELMRPTRQRTSRPVDDASGMRPADRSRQAVDTSRRVSFLPSHPERPFPPPTRGVNRPFGREGRKEGSHVAPKRRHRQATHPPQATARHSEKAPALLATPGRARPASPRTSPIAAIRHRLHVRPRRPGARTPGPRPRPGRRRTGSICTTHESPHDRTAADQRTDTPLHCHPMPPVQSALQTTPRHSQQVGHRPNLYRHGHRHPGGRSAGQADPRSVRGQSSVRVLSP
jgi:hypothetical protein